MARPSGTKSAGATEPQQLDQAWARSALPRRSPGAHKWGVGGLVVVAGSPPFAGAAALCCASAARSGAGIVSAALPRSIAQIVVGLVPEITLVVLPEGDSTSIAARSASAIEERLRRSGALLVGPGLGDDEGTAALLGTLFGFTQSRGGIGFSHSRPEETSDDDTVMVFELEKPVVLDADALNWLSGQERWWERVPRDVFVLTPHIGEMARLLGADIDSVLAKPVSVARDAAAKWGQTVVLKGSPTVVAHADGVTMHMETSPALATAGSGDVLSGSIGAFLAQGLSGLDAAGLAVYVGNLAAERVARRFGTLGVVAGDLPVAIAEELRSLELEGA
ncbi:MAG: NAD(P)H-hydrate dehydratase [Chloroflexia bacterium]|nr:NAD(P)H-hydrate dehydratase [Chloroflexia bacterium]